MDDPLYRGMSVRSATVGDGRLVVRGDAFGPAGLSWVDLPDGSRWEVDHADPASLVSIEVDERRGGDAPLLVAAFGGDEALRWAEEAHLGAPESDDAVLPPDRPARRPRGTPAMLSLDGPRAADSGRLVLLADLSSDHRLHPLARVVAGLELGVRTAAFPGGGLLGDVAAGAVLAARRLASEVDEIDVEVLDASELRALHDLLVASEPAGDVDRAALAVLADHVVDLLGSGPVVRVAALAPPAGPLEPAEPAPSATAAAAWLVVGDAGVPHDTSVGRVRRAGEAVVEVGVPRGAGGGRWARVVHRHGLVLLGQAPLLPHGRDMVAEVVVPAGVGDADLLVGLVGGAGLPAPPEGSLEAVRAAISRGRDACRAERLGDRASASARWERCAELWERAGDRARAEQAVAFAAHPPRRMSAAAPLADRIAVALER